MNIVEVAESAKDIVRFDNDVFCPECTKQHYSPFDKLYITAYDRCVLCTPDDDVLERNASNIFAIVEVL